jgi:hypothetical protein
MTNLDFRRSNTPSELASVAMTTLKRWADKIKMKMANLVLRFFSEPA